MKIKAAIPLIHHLILLAKVKFSKVKIKFQGSGLAPWACRPFIGDEKARTGSMGAVGRASAMPEVGIRATSH